MFFPSDTFQPLLFSYIVTTKSKTYQELKFQTHNNQVDLKLEKSRLNFLYPYADLCSLVQVRSWWFKSWSLSAEPSPPGAAVAFKEAGLLQEHFRWVMSVSCASLWKFL